MTDLIEAARAALAYMDSIGPTDMYQEEAEIAEGLRAALRAAERAEQVEPVAYRLEIRWRDRALDQSWRKYADTAYRDRAISWRDSANNMETESRIIPLYAGEPEGE